MCDRNLLNEYNRRSFSFFLGVGGGGGGTGVRTYGVVDETNTHSYNNLFLRQLQPDSILLCVGRGSEIQHPIHTPTPQVVHELLTPLPLSRPTPHAPAPQPPGSSPLFCDAVSLSAAVLSPFVLFPL